MAYLHGEFTKVEEIKDFLEQWAPECPPEVVAEASKVEHHCSSFEDSGPDWNEYRVFGADGKQIWSVRKDGY